MNMYPEMPNEKISIWKRIFIFLIDFITALILCVALLYSIGNPIVSSIAKNDINKMNVAIIIVTIKNVIKDSIIFNIFFILYVPTFLFHLIIFYNLYNIL